MRHKSLEKEGKHTYRHSERKTWAYLDVERRDHNQYIHLPKSIWNCVARYFTFFYLKNQITEYWFFTLVKCCFCEEWRHCGSEVLPFIFMNQNLAIWDHLIPTIQSLMWPTCQYATMRERHGLIWIWRGETIINTYIRLNPFETVWPDILLFFLLKESDNRGLIFDFSEVLLLWRVTAL